MKITKILFVVSVLSFLTLSGAFSQESSSVNNQLWFFSFFNWKLDDKWVYNQDFGYQHTFDTPTYIRLFSRSQINRQVTGDFSLHGGMNFLYRMNETSDNILEIRPWVGAKLRWPSFWRFDFTHYIRFEQRFEYTFSEDDWNEIFRLRYRISSQIPITHVSVVDKSLYGLIAAEYFTVSFGDYQQEDLSDIFRIELGVGYQQNIKNRYEFLVMGYESKEEKGYQLSDIVFFFKYRRYMNWE